jgi:RNA-binding protein 39
MRFENMQGAVNAQRALHGRWFAGKMITAAFMVIIQFLTILVISFVDATYAASKFY